MITDPVGRFGDKMVDLRREGERLNMDDDDFRDAAMRQVRLTIINYLQAEVDGLLNMSEKR